MRSRGAPRGRRRRGGLRHGRGDHRVGAGAARGRRAGASSAGSGCRASPRTGRPRRCSSTGATSRPRRGRTARAGRSGRGSTTSSAGTPRSTGPRCRGSGCPTSRRCAHLEGVSPAWPFRYADLEAYYGEAERLYAVHGTTGEDPTEPWRSTPYPYAALPHEPYVAALADRLRAAGVRPSSTAIGVDLRPGGSCVRCATCDGFPCRLGAKSDAEVCAIDPALATGSARLATGVRVRATGDGRVRAAGHPGRGGRPVRDR